ncbi:Acyl-CoA dehydrogenase [Sphingobium sp. AP50]|uniref:acyl-CoA dehydrogenase family protein n=1 Tax=Sphingobium sp. AP50 TaxID=1884369 RepID=UPI0008C4219B|nr:acyl-CoA dehydrogenase family protein [Sphingobium sp. AP50]SEJ66094.1 Acyl-CoA dehydrogenase [Sphingobium sp. AP50]
MATIEQTSGTVGSDGFREYVRGWLFENFPAELKGQEHLLAAVDGSEEETPVQTRWREAMGSKGWGTPTWPSEYGGGGLTSEDAEVLREEMRRIGAWNPIGGMGVLMLGPTVLQYGSEAQKHQHIPGIVRGEVRWCQGYSEPSAGSDLASLQTFAEDRGDHYLVNGQKTWTSAGQWAHWCFALVRTDRSQKHGGISFLLIDMTTPGIETRPIRLISGISPFCETFFTDVVVPKVNLVGIEGQGWEIGTRLLQHERSSISGDSGPTVHLNAGDSVPEIAKRYLGVDADGRIVDSDLRSRIIRHEMDRAAFALTLERIKLNANVNAGPSAASSITKNVGARITLERAELNIEIMGLNGLGVAGPGFSKEELEQTYHWLKGKAVSIYGGSTEVQNNVIAKRILGMLDHQ